MYEKSENMMPLAPAAVSTETWKNNDDWYKYTQFPVHYIYLAKDNVV